MSLRGDACIYIPPARAPSGSSDGFTTWAHPGLSRSLCSDQRPDGSSWRPSGSSALPYSAAPSASIAAAFSHRVRVVRRGAHLVRELHYSGTVPVVETRKSTCHRLRRLLDQMGGVESSTGYDSGEGEGFPDRVHCGASWCPEENHFGPRDGVYNGEYEDRIELTAIAHGKRLSPTSGLVESTNRTVSGILSAYVNAKHNDWDELLPFVMLALNTAEQPKESCLPWPRDVSLPHEVFKERLEQRRKGARSNCLRSQATQKKYRYTPLYERPLYECSLLRRSRICNYFRFTNELRRRFFAFMKKGDRRIVRLLQFAPFF
ncbi:LOW QUALITY PROTEIN: hypothetical protein M513_07948 [Trichuris suis]|uniref:Integrase catalytic domain-containing protein n=1 Tax=Trichuris suis TaxID=68888 RepID=A0A085M1T8_9BILA|nr:LOW QUALITY PROTEIN: hypothetical protein M513_07948 [Trichuris suis]